MKFRGLICIVLVAVLLTFVGCRNSDTDKTTTAPDTVATTITTTNKDLTSTTTVNGNGTTTVNSQSTTLLPSDVTTDINGEMPTYKDTSALTMHEVSVNGMPVIVGDSRNRIRINAAGLLNGNAENPMFILVTNVGEDDIFSATITATAGGKEISFNISYLPRGGSVWAESIDLYKYNPDDKFIVSNDAVIVTSTSAGVPIDRDYNGILNIYAGEKDGGKGIFVENISGKTLKKVIIKYRPISSGGGLYASPSQLILENFEDGAKAFKANSYLFDVDIVDVQIIY